MQNREANSVLSEEMVGQSNALPSVTVPFFPEIPRQDNLVFDGAIRTLFHHEGFWSNDPNDPGGPTKFGWSLRTAKQLGDLDGDGKLDFDIDGDGDIDIHDIRALTAQQAVERYKRVFWKPQYDMLPPVIAGKVFNLGVNMGSKQAHILLQRAIRANTKDPIEEDGFLGPKTLKLANRAYQPALLSAVRSEAAGFYRQLVIQRPKSKKYINGWLIRAYS